MNHVDIVIPCAGRVNDLLRLLETIHSACAASLPLHCASITVTDDRHTQALHDQVKARFPAVNYVAGPARGPAVNRNHGAAIGRAPWILFLDDDCFVESDLLDAYALRIEAAPEVDVFEGAIHPVGPRPNGNHHAPLNLSGGLLWSCNLLLRRQVFERVGRFDEDFPFACLEDCELRERLKAHQARIAFADDAVVFHPWRSITEKEVSRQIISHAIYAHKHPPFARTWSLVHLLRAMRGRVRQYRLGKFASIPRERYRTVGFDFIAPALVYAVVRVPSLRRLIWNRHRNRLAGQP